MPILRKIQFEFQLQKIVEVGVKDIVCYISAKTKDQYNLEKEIEKTERYQEIIKSAFLQSENLYLPKISFIDSLCSFNIEKFQNAIVLQQNAKEVLGVNIDCDLIISGGEIGRASCRERV